MNLCDVSRVIKYDAGLEVEIDLVAAEVSGDGKVDTTDAEEILVNIAK